MSASEKIANILLDIKAVHLSPKDLFTWTSGIKSPIYCDNRQIISYPDHRKTVAQAFADIIKEKFPKTQMIAGTATAGIPHAAWVADILNLPMVYIRSGSKGHGLQNQIEGKVEAGQKVIVIEDLISTGKSSVNAINALLDVDCDVLHTLAIFSYELNKSAAAFKNIKQSYTTICKLDTLLNVAKNKMIVEEKEINEIKEFFSSL
jgi:orotate phosphoribosyltransferase